LPQGREKQRVIQEVTTDPNSHPELTIALSRLYKSLIYRPPFDAKLNVYERAAFGMVVDSYAKPVAEVQLRAVEARDKLMSQGLSTGGRLLNYEELGCVTDPFGYGCPRVAGFIDEKPNEAAKK
jgi:hypothetical protein